LPVGRLKIDDAVLGRENTVQFCRNSAVEYLVGLIPQYNIIVT